MKKESTNDWLYVPSIDLFVARTPIQLEKPSFMLAHSTLHKNGEKMLPPMEFIEFLKVIREDNPHQDLYDLLIPNKYTAEPEFLDGVIHVKKTEAPTSRNYKKQKLTKKEFRKKQKFANDEWNELHFDFQHTYDPINKILVPSDSRKLSRNTITGVWRISLDAILDGAYTHQGLPSTDGKKFSHYKNNITYAGVVGEVARRKDEWMADSCNYHEDLKIVMSFGGFQPIGDKRISFGPVFYKGQFETPLSEDQETVFVRPARKTLP